MQKLIKIQKLSFPLNLLLCGCVKERVYMDVCDTKNICDFNLSTVCDIWSWNRITRWFMVKFCT